MEQNDLCPTIVEPLVAPKRERRMRQNEDDDVFRLSIQSTRGRNLNAAVAVSSKKQQKQESNRNRHAFVDIKRIGQDLPANASRDVVSSGDHESKTALACPGVLGIPSNPLPGRSCP